MLVGMDNRLRLFIQFRFLHPGIPVRQVVYAGFLAGNVSGECGLRIEIENVAELSVTYGPCGTVICYSRSSVLVDRVSAEDIFVVVVFSR